MSDAKLPFATLVSTPTTTSWSQSYNAGRLYAVLSLTHNGEDGAKLATTGKDIINALVEEYFTLEVKNLDSIKKAIVETTKKISDDFDTCFVVVSIVNNILYAFSYGGGKVLIKRKGKVGVILNPPSEAAVHAVSGYLQDSDIIMLATKQGADIITEKDLAADFANPAEAVEMFSPKVHEGENGDASAIILSYIEDTQPDVAPEIDEEKDEKDELEEAEEEKPLRSPFYTEEQLPPKPKKSFSFPTISFSMPKLPQRLSSKRMLFLLIPLVLLIILSAAMYMAKQQEEQSKIQALFTKVYPQAEKHYNEGVALLSLNKQLAHDDFLKAKTLIETNSKNFPQGSSEQAKLAALLEKIKSQGALQSGGQTLTAKEVTSDVSPLLAALIKTKGLYATKNEETIYVGRDDAIQNNTGKTIIANDNAWEQMAGIGAFGTNLYVLDSKGDQILKFSNASESSKSVYASKSFSNGGAMAIDGSIYVLNTDGSITKYTRGTKDTFGISAMETPFKKPTRIFTDSETDNIYVLDPGSSRVVSLSKSGVFQQAYTATIIKDAKDFDVHEKDKKLYILASGNIYEINMP